ncbi:Cysteine ABC transport system periplasmic binding component (plasmid) [Neorhizobium galegae bv. officinalis bv. officinalis str. HAMBI 1141]|uniref:Cysteine ABC transport system periplasmic binding component n=1 Tax=Neorhizobium galegae bv. officinalis bv. officinalis str. HAMBI 1141 TaxID=1028801 RepID=A0A068TGI3_NEOGA|nr:MULTISPECIES: ABC transporter substrate-binding protein [Neorhizobium]MCJ9669373.1 ABC transporter substrate-binding protein [Neorhizobium sp. SHOUNA12B]MCJ9745241.1 ABC transporter substrate-binding protein [Neorhizobium sp. SHOUNA12A]CDN57557.1 Cysteine ABC transport system periplasmic binding component [Neorhizobium galegae bv. officinalis bv. officinalis str. HAMBI 1141]
MSLFKKTFSLLAAGLLSSALGLSAADAAEDIFDLSPDQPGRIRAEKDPAAIAAIPKDFKLATPGKFTVAVSPGGPPLATYATDAKTVVGADPEYALAIADSLGLKLELIPVAWADWPLGLVSGKYDAVISNVGVTELRKEKFDFSTYRQGLHGFFVKADSAVKEIKEPKDAAGLRITVGASTNQERILLKWSDENVKAGLKPIELVYHDDDGARLVALRSGRVDVIVQPHAQLVYIAARDKNIRRVGTLSAGWPERSDVAITTRKGSGLAAALTLATNNLIKNGTYGKLLARWQLSEEALPQSQTNPPGLPKS